MKITLQEISKSFGGRDIFSNFSLDIESGMHLCVCGPNGMGKSTLLRMIAGVESIDCGHISNYTYCRSPEASRFRGLGTPSANLTIIAPIAGIARVCAQPAWLCAFFYFCRAPPFFEKWFYQIFQKRRAKNVL